MHARVKIGEKTLDFVVPCLLGLEGLIAQELRSLGADAVRAENGRVFFVGDAAVLARANISLRCAERVQVVIGRFRAVTFDELFEGAKALDWAAWIGVKDAFPVKGFTLNSALFSERDCQAILKKAVVESLKARYRVPWFEESGPPRQIQFALQKDDALLTLDSSGAGLHKRGYRTQAGDAPLKETLAAALCMLARLRPYHTLYDPLCGSGTILIEGALLARNIAPGLRRDFSAERWAQIPSGVWREARKAARAAERPAPDFAGFGSDIDPEVLVLAAENARRAGVSDLLRWQTADLRDFRMDTPRGTLITNPPYGERLGDTQTADDLVRLMGRVFPQEHGKSYAVLSPDEEFESHFGRRADTRRKLYNGMHKCQLFMYHKDAQVRNTPRTAAVTQR
jgi:putative N6-adenine-specific DNA methylase